MHVRDWRGSEAAKLPGAGVARRRRHAAEWLAGAIVLLCLAGIASSTGLAAAARAATEPPLRVVASIFPLGDIAARVGGDALQVQVLLPAGATPHGFEPTPAQAEQLSAADLLLTVGLGVDAWADAGAQASGNRKLARLSFAEVVARDSVAGAARLDPHLWLDPLLADRFAAAVADLIAERRPAHADSIRARAARFRSALSELDREHRERLGPLVERRFIALHPAFSLLAARYGLIQISVYDPHMHEPGPRAMEAVLHAVREEGVRAVFGEPQMPAAGLDWLREQAGVATGLLDPLGNPARPGYDGYLAMMRSNLAELERGLSAAPPGR